jgi:hypothetical protein
MAPPASSHQDGLATVAQTAVNGGFERGFQLLPVGSFKGILIITASSLTAVWKDSPFNQTKLPAVCIE